MISNFTYEQALSIVVCLFNSRMPEDLKMVELLCKCHNITEEDVIQYKIDLWANKKGD